MFCGQDEHNSNQAAPQCMYSEKSKIDILVHFIVLAINLTAVFLEVKSVKSVTS